MAETIGEAFVAVRPEPGTERQFADGLRSRLGGPLRGVGKVVGASLGAGLLGAVAGLGVIIHTGLGEAMDAARVNAQTAAAIKSTGGAAKVSADQVSALASALQDQTGIADDAIQKAENLLLTFTGIRNEAGKGNDIFTQATGILTDMSVALGTDVSGSAIQLGKALNDPVKGVTALTRVGVTFTEQQVKQIKALSDAGKTADAQKIILAELRKEFGGSAKAYGETLPGQLAKARRAFENMAEGAVSALLPLAGPLLDLLGKGLRALAPVVEKVVDTFGRMFGALTAGFADAAPEMGEGAPFFSFLLGAGRVLREQLLPAVARFGEFIRGTLVPALAELGQRIGPPVFEMFRRGGEFVAQSLLPALRSLGEFIATNILPVIAAVAEFIVTEVVPVVQSLERVLIDNLRKAFETIGKKIEENRPQLEQLGRALRTVATFIVRTLAPVLRVVLGTALKIIGKAIGLVIDAVGFLIDAFNKVRSVVGTVVGFMTDAFHTWQKIVLGIVNFVIDAVNKVIDAINAIPNIKVPGLGTVGIPDIDRLQRLALDQGTSGSTGTPVEAASDERRARATGRAVADALHGTVVVLDDRAVGAIDTRQGYRAARR